MRIRVLFLALVALIALPAFADENLAYTRTLENFRGQPATAPFFNESVAYVVFPTIGKVGFLVGGALGMGRAYKNGAYVGDVKTGQLSFGWQWGAQAYSEIIFFQNEEVFKDFTSDSFQFGADTSAVALTAGAQASASTKGMAASAGTSAENTDDSAAKWYRGMAVFTMAKGGLMVQAALSGQAFDYEALAK